MAIHIDVDGELSEEQGGLLVALVDDLLRFAAIPDQRHLHGVLVVPSEQIAAAVNALREDDRYGAGPYPPPAVAVPIDRSGELRCYVVVALELVALLQPDRTRPIPLVSALLEELLHISVYVAAWRRRGWIEPPLLQGKARDLFVIGANIHDEYVVNRAKAAISAREPIYDHPELPGMGTTLVLAYGGQVAAHLAAADEELDTLSRRLAASQIATDETWGLLAEIVYRQIFEPLVREAGYRAGTPEDERRPPNDARSVPFYRDRVAPYWERVLASLNRSYRTQLSEMDAALDDLVGILEAFITDLNIVTSG